MSLITITGANRGIGLALAEIYRARADEVVAVCRDSSAELDRLGVRVESGVDVTSDGDVDDLAARLHGLHIDVLINNAGLLTDEGLDDLDLSQVRRQLEVNAVGPLRVTRALLSLMRDGGKLALITSRMGSLADNTSGGYYGYRMSKAALNMAGVSLAHDLRPRRIAVAILHPGYVRTGMTGQQGFVDPPESARGLIARIDALTLETSGTFWHQNGEVIPW